MPDYTEEQNEYRKRVDEAVDGIKALGKLRQEGKANTQEYRTLLAAIQEPLRAGNREVFDQFQKVGDRTPVEYLADLAVRDVSKIPTNNLQQMLRIPTREDMDVMIDAEKKIYSEELDRRKTQAVQSPGNKPVPAPDKPEAAPRVQQPPANQTFTLKQGSRITIPALPATGFGPQIVVKDIVGDKVHLQLKEWISSPKGVNGQGATKVTDYEFDTSKPITIGRGEGAAIQLEGFEATNRHVSRDHARISVIDGVLTYENLEGREKATIDDVGAKAALNNAITPRPLGDAKPLLQEPQAAKRKPGLFARFIPGAHGNDGITRDRTGSPVFEPRSEDGKSLDEIRWEKQWEARRNTSQSGAGTQLAEDASLGRVGQGNELHATKAPTLSAAFGEMSSVNEPVILATDNNEALRTARAGNELFDTPTRQDTRATQFADDASSGRVGQGNEVHSAKAPTLSAAFSEMSSVNEPVIIVSDENESLRTARARNELFDTPVRQDVRQELFGSPDRNPNAVTTEPEATPQPHTAAPPRSPTMPLPKGMATSAVAASGALQIALGAQGLAHAQTPTDYAIAAGNLAVGTTQTAGDVLSVSKYGIQLKDVGNALAQSASPLKQAGGQVLKRLPVVGYGLTAADIANKTAKASPEKKADVFVSESTIAGGTIGTGIGVGTAAATLGGSTALVILAPAVVAVGVGLAAGDINASRQALNDAEAAFKQSPTLKHADAAKSHVSDEIHFLLGERHLPIPYDQNGNFDVHAVDFRKKEYADVFREAIDRRIEDSKTTALANSSAVPRFLRMINPGDHESLEAEVEANMEVGLLEAAKKELPAYAEQYGDILAKRKALAEATKRLQNKQEALEGAVRQLDKDGDGKITIQQDESGIGVTIDNRTYRVPEGPMDSTTLSELQKDRAALLLLAEANPDAARAAELLSKVSTLANESTSKPKTEIPSLPQGEQMRKALEQYMADKTTGGGIPLKPVDPNQPRHK